MKPTPTNPLRDLLAYLREFKSRCAAAIWPAAQLHVENAQEIAAEVAAHQAEQAQAAYAAEQSDIEASRLLTAVIKDGKVTAAEIRLLRKAAALVTASAAHDHNICEALT